MYILYKDFRQLIYHIDLLLHQQYQLDFHHLMPYLKTLLTDFNG